MNARRGFLFGVSTTAVALACALFWAGPRETARAAAEHPTDRATTHNMVVFGEETVYLSHLPLFQEDGQPPMPHRYQAILEVTLAKQDVYAKDRRAHRTTKIYTLTPEVFVLPQLVSTDPQHKPVRSFKARTIFRGHLERDNPVAILRDVEVKVTRVSHFRMFDPKATRPAQLEYLLFGKGRELFLAHLITAPPDFDQILAVKVTGHELTNEELAKGVVVVFPGTANTTASRLREKQRGAGEMNVGSGPAPRKIQVEVSRELYLEEGELQMPSEPNTTALEKEAGFP